MSDTEPSLLRDPAAGSVGGAAGDDTARVAAPAPIRAAPALEPPRPASRAAPTVHVAGFWQRALAAAIDLAIVGPIAALVIFLVGKIAGIALATRVGLLDLDLWIDLVLATDPALVMGLTLLAGLGLAYLLVCHIALGRTIGMRVARLRVIDVYGDAPSPGRCVARCAGYLAGAATLFLGFLWVGFDSEKRGLHDWIAGTYVIRG